MYFLRCIFENPIVAPTKPSPPCCLTSCPKTHTMPFFISCTFFTIWHIHSFLDQTLEYSNCIWSLVNYKLSMHLSFKKNVALLASPSHSILANPTLGSTALIYSKLVHPSSTHWKHPTPVVKLHWILFSSHSILIQTYLNLVFCSNKHKGDSNERWAL